MNPTLIKLGVCALVLGAAFSSGFGVRAYMAGKDQLAADLAAQKTLTAAHAQHATALKDLATKNQELQSTVNKLDTQHTKDLNEQLDENARLRTDLSVAQRMRLTGTTCPRTSTPSDDPGTSGLGDGAGIELSEATRLAVWDLRAAILGDQAKVTYLQDYVRSVCRPPGS